MEIRKFLNPKTLKWAVLTCRITGLIIILSNLISLLFIALTYPATTFYGIPFLVYKAIYTEGLLSVDSVAYLAFFIAQILLGIVFYIFSYAFTALIDIADELENTI